MTYDDGMPSITAYTPYEALTFFQSIVRHGADASALQTISTTLKQNEFIRDSDARSNDQFSPDALRKLYDAYMSQVDGSHNVAINGDLENGERSPKRRKLSSPSRSPTTSTSRNLEALQQLVDRLYIKYKDDAIRQIRQDEDSFTRLQDEIKALEQQVDGEARQETSTKVPQVEDRHRSTDRTTQASTESAVASRSSAPSAPRAQDVKPTNVSYPKSNDGPAASNRATSDTKSPVPTESTGPRVLPSNQQARAAQQATPTPNQHQSPGTLPRPLPSQPAQRQPYAQIQAQMYSPGPGPGAHVGPQGVNSQTVAHVPSQQRLTQGRGSPVPYQNQQPYSPYAAYQTPQWHPHMSPPPYQQHGPYPPPPHYYQPGPNGRHPQTPQPGPYSQYAHSASVPYMQHQQQQQQQQQWRGPQWSIPAASAVNTPISRPASRMSLPGSSSSTPWKRQSQSNLSRQKSPSRPQRDVSPLTDKEDSPPPVEASQQDNKGVGTRKEDEPAVQRQPRRRGRPPSMTPSAMGPSRSQSIASRASDFQNDKQTGSRRGQKIKAEAPSTPMALPSSDTDQKSSGRRGRPRGGTVSSQADGARLAMNKRKRDSISPTPPTRSPKLLHGTPPSRLLQQPHDSSLIVVSKNFAKTSQLLLNEITSHKLAGIFAKPLSERDAPGYKDLVTRPQDLKGVKAAVSKGSRAALVAIEAIEGENETTPTKAQSSISSTAGIGAIGNGFYQVTKTADLVPPKGIVNSAQLEMELVRMFANAIMFNPLPPSERGFGKNLRLRKHGGDVVANSERDSTSEDSDNGSTSGVDEDGIIADAREMFNDVVEIVAKWRELEGERMGSGTDASTGRHGSLAIPSLPVPENSRHVSVSASSNVGEDEATAGESEATSTPMHNNTGPGRKRRKVAEH